MHTREVKGKTRSRSESEPEQGVQCVCLHPKPGDLAMSRMKQGRNPVEVRTDVR